MHIGSERRRTKSNVLCWLFFIHIFNIQCSLDRTNTWIDLAVCLSLHLQHISYNCGENFSFKFFFIVFHMLQLGQKTSQTNQHTKWHRKNRYQMYYTVQKTVTHTNFGQTENEKFPKGRMEYTRAQNNKNTIRVVCFFSSLLW